MKMITAHQLKPGDALTSGLVVRHVWITERNEWLTVHIETDEGITTHGFYDKVPATPLDSHTTN